MKEYSKTDRIDQIFAELEAHESAKKEKYLLGVCVVATTLILVFLSSLVISHNKSSALYTQIEEEKLSNESLLLYAENRTPISVPDSYTPTPKPEGYANNLLDAENTRPELSTFTSQGIKLDISGTKTASNPLDFRILNFDSDMIYRVDFGNGEGKKVGETFSYTYEESGAYTFKIIGYGKFNQRQKLQITLAIENAESAISMSN